MLFQAFLNITGGAGVERAVAACEDIDVIHISQFTIFNNSDSLIGIRSLVIQVSKVRLK